MFYCMLVYMHVANKNAIHFKNYPKKKNAKSDISWIQSLAIYDIEHTLSLSHDYMTAKKALCGITQFWQCIILIHTPCLIKKASRI